MDPPVMPPTRFTLILSMVGVSGLDVALFGNVALAINMDTHRNTYYSSVELYVGIKIYFAKLSPELLQNTDQLVPKSVVAGRMAQAIIV